MTRKEQACSSCHARKIRCDAISTNNTFVPCSSCRSQGSICRPHLRKRRRDAKSTTILANESQVSTDRFPLSEEINARKKIRLQPSYLGRADYLETHVPIDEEYASQYGVASDPGPENPESGVKTQDLTLDQLASPSIRESLLQSFLKRCWPWMPLLEPGTIQEIVRTSSSPSFLMLTVLVAGSKVANSPRAAEVGQRCYQRAKMMFYLGEENNTFHVIIGTIFLQWWNQSGPEHISIDNSSFWLRAGVALAHQLGLHRQLDDQQFQAPLRRKVWWTLVSRDNQIATSHGRPRAINMQDSIVPPLNEHDFTSSNEDALLFVNFVEITKILGDLTQACLRGGLSDQQRKEFKISLLSWLRNLPKPFHLFDREALTLNPYNFRSRQLHVPYFVALIIIFRKPQQSACPSGISILAASFISGIFEEYLDWGDTAFVSAASIFYMLVASLVQISSHRFLSFSINAENESTITNQALSELKKRYPTAVGAERIIDFMRKTSLSRRGAIQTAEVRLEAGHEDLFNLLGSSLCSHWNKIVGCRSLTNSSGQTPGAVDPLEIDLPRLGQNQDVDAMGTSSHLDSADVNDLGYDMLGQWWCSDLFSGN